MSDTVDKYKVVLYDSAGNPLTFENGRLPVSTGATLTPYRNLDVGSTGVTVKASSGQLFGYYISNHSNASRYIKIYDKGQSIPNQNDTPVFTFEIPAGAAANRSFGSGGVAFSNGIGIRATTGVADTDTGAPTANDVIVNLEYR